MLSKRYCSMIGITALLISVLLCFAGCGHKHEFGKWRVKTEATCEEAGKQVRYCADCDEYEEQEIPALGHQYDEASVVVEASCIGNGTIRYTCNRDECGYFYEEEYALPTYSDTQIYEQSVQYVGEIVVYDRKGAELGLGTCFVYTADGKIVTNYHVIDSAYSAKVTIGQNVYDVTHVLTYDQNIDLAILKIDAEGLVAATICTNPVQTGSTVFAIGSSRGLTNTYSKGIVTYADRVVENVSHIQHDASITNGNSGGPLINIYGEVIGINTWGINDSQNLNFAVSATELNNLPEEKAISMAEFYKKTFVPQEELYKWLMANYNASAEGEIRYDYTYENAWYSLGYDTDDKYMYLDVLWEFDSGAELYMCIDLEKNETRYSYYARYTYSGQTNKTYGYINPANFSEKTSLVYTSYNGSYWDKTQLLDLYRNVAVDLLTWFEWMADESDMGVTLEDMGFYAI